MFTRGHDIPTGYGGYEIDNGAVFDGSSDNLSFTPASAGDRQSVTINIGYKRAALGSVQYLWSAGSSSSDYTAIFFDANDKLNVIRVVSSTTDAQKISSKRFRDPGAFGMLTIKIDSADTNLDVYDNGDEITAWDTDNEPSATNGAENNTVTHTIGARSYSQSGTYFNGYIVEFRQVESANDNAAFGGFWNGTNKWRWISADGLIFGNAGSYLDFSNAGNLGEDQAGSNDWTVNGSPSQTGDTPTNNACTYNALQTASAVTLSNGNRTAAHGAFSSNGGTYGTIALASGRWYWETTVDALSSGSIFLGVVGAGYAEPHTTLFANESTGFAYRSNGQKRNNSTDTAYGSTYTTSDVIGVALDLDNGAIWFSKNGTWQNSATVGEIEAGTTTNAAYTGLSGEMVPADMNGTSGGTYTTTVSFAQDEWTYTAPTGFLSITAANLPAVTVTDSEDYFVAVTDTEANISSALSTARSGWTDYIDIFKNRDAIESWYWRFSDDSSNCFNSDSTDAKESFPTLSGSDGWVAYSLRLNGLANIKGGSGSHTNGADTTVTHNAGNARCMIILFPEGGGARPVYHPDLTSGNLLYLDATSGETLDSAIKNVTANTFDIDADEATGTYWYIVIPETEGFAQLCESIGNANSNGSFSYTGIKPTWSLTKCKSTTGPWYNYDDQRSSINEIDDQLLIDDPTIETTGSHEIDFVSNGVKERGPDAGTNGSSQTHVRLVIGQAFGGSNIPLGLAQ